MRRFTVALATAVLLSAVACSTSDDGDAGVAAVTDDAGGATTGGATTDGEEDVGTTGDVFTPVTTSDSSDPDAPGASEPPTAPDPTAASGSDRDDRGDGDDRTGPAPTGTTGTPEEELDESLSELGVGEGTGVVVIDDAEWTFDAEICDARRGFNVAGLASGPDGQAGFVEIYVDPSVDLDGDGEPDESGTVALAVGRTELFGESDAGQPLWLALLQTFTEVDQRDFSYRIDGRTIAGEGEIRNARDVAAPRDETVPLTFEASCG